METKTLYPPLEDAPEPAGLKAIIQEWQRPDLPDVLKNRFHLSGKERFAEVSRLFQSNLDEIKSNRSRSRIVLALVDWLCDFVRMNVKRGRVFDLRQVLKEGRTDCVGYNKLLTLLGRLCGLDMGVVEVLIDNAGRYVPHTATLLKLPDGRLRFIDLWYGSQNIKHRRLGLQVKHGNLWRIEDVDFKDSSGPEEVSYLPDACVDAITLYIRANRHLNQRGFADAVKLYSRALKLYPGNPRFYYNRAIAYENLGEPEKASADYARSLRDEASLIRILATEHEETTALIALDSKSIDGLAQEIYLLARGFVTGRKTSPAE